MNIGIDARLVKRHKSGLVGYIENLVAELAKNPENKLTVFIQKKEQKAFSFLNNQTNIKFIPVFFNNHFLDISNFLYEQSFFSSVINKQALDIFHNPFGFGIPRGIKTKTLLTVHDIIPLYDYDELNHWQKIVYKFSFELSLKKAAKIITISEFTKKELLKAYPQLNIKNIQTIYNGYDHLAKTNYSVSLLKYLPIKKPYILYIGSATKRKNLLNLVQAFITLKKQGNFDYQLVLASKFDRPITQKTKNQIILELTKNKLKDSVFFTGYIENEEKAVLLANAEIFVYPSLYEGFGLPILEAMDFDLPVACSDIPVFREIYKDGVAYFDPLDVQSIAKIIKVLLIDIDLRKQIISKERLIRNQFSWKKMANQYQIIYQQLLK
jgi:glycosyltransferase involved in cell wall biosynthesis